MKSNYRNRNKNPLATSVLMKNGHSKFIPIEQVKEALDFEWEQKVNLVYAEVKRDVATQILAVMLCYLKLRYHYTPKTLNSIKEGMESLFELMTKEGIFGRPFTPTSCIEWLETNGITFRQLTEEERRKLIEDKKT